MRPLKGKERKMPGDIFCGRGRQGNKDNGVYDTSGN